jgi:hypothetical protein
MSLDVWLKMKGAAIPPQEMIFIREDGQTKPISLEEWQERFPDREPIVTKVEDGGEVFSANITGNLAGMAKAAGLYGALCHPEDLQVTRAFDLIGYLAVGLAKLESDPNHFKVYNPKNGWGDYEGLVAFVRNYLNACLQYPDATVHTWV